MNTNTRSTQLPQLSASELVSAPFEVFCLPVLGRLLKVPPGHRAVLTGPQGIVHELGEGLQSLSGLPWGLYMVQMVNARRFHLQPGPVRALTGDGWQANILVTLECRVYSPRAVVHLDNPLSTLREAAGAAITHVIKTTPHDVLIGTADQSSQDFGAIVARIQRELQSTLRGSGLEVVNVLAAQPQGDERRLEIKRQLLIDETQISADQTVVAKRIELERGQQDLVLVEAETKRKKAEEEQRIRVAQARIEATVTQLVRWVREWETQLQLIPELSRQRHEQILEAIKAYGQVLGKMAELGNLEVLGVSSRRRPEELGLDRIEAVLTQGLANLQKLLIEESRVLASGNADVWQEPHAPLLVRLVGEISELSTIEGCTHTDIELDENGSLCLEVHLDGKTVEIICSPDFPATSPEVFVSANGLKRIPYMLRQRDPKSLKEVVLEAARRFSGAAPTHGATSRDPAA
ncbi:MAG: SPFH domain-containing protein [Promethearchaeota archaeon]